MLRPLPTTTLVLLLAAACSTPRAPRLEGARDHRVAVTTDRSEAQGFFDQGLRFVYASDAPEALRAFEEAARLDPGCAMAYWGQALVLGSGKRTAETERRAAAAMDKAIARSGPCTARERGLIEALSLRFSAVGGTTPREREAAYAEAMGKLSQRFPDDADVRALSAVAFMDTRPEGWWQPDGTPRPGTAAQVAALEGVLRREPDHPGALQAYVRLVESSATPALAEPYADRLERLATGAGGALPARVFLRVGRYADASNAAQTALVAEQDYLAQCRLQGIEPVERSLDSHVVLWQAATMEGRSETALRSARAAATSSRQAGDAVTAECLRAAPWLALVRFGRWDEVMSQPAPDPKARLLTALWHYARGVASAAQGRTDAAADHLSALRNLARDPELADSARGLERADKVLRVAEGCLAGELAAREGRLDEAVGHLRQAARAQDALGAGEPPIWHYPVRQSLGAVLIEAGRLDEAETVYREDLGRWPENGWSLFGLAQVLGLKGDTAAARNAQSRFAEAFSAADVRLTASVFR